LWRIGILKIVMLYVTAYGVCCINFIKNCSNINLSSFGLLCVNYRDCFVGGGVRLTPQLFHDLLSYVVFFDLCR
jgi:hypothetical protein